MSAPEFESTALELQADALTRLLQGQKLLIPLEPNNHQRVAVLLKAFKTGKKEMVHERVQAFYEQVLDPVRLVQAYAYLRTLPLEGHPEFEIVMDSLKEQCHTEINPAQKMEIRLLDALIQVMLAITRGSKNSISYSRFDPAMDRPRPTTFPLTPIFIERFLAPFAQEKQMVLSRTVYFYKNTVIGNPAAELAWHYRQRRDIFEEKREAYLKAEQARLAREAAAIPKASLEARHKVKAASVSVKQVLGEVKNPQEKAAVHYTLQPDNLYGLLRSHQQSKDGFQQKLQAIYAQKVSHSQAGALSARLASKMKRVLEQMDQWDESYWSEFQGLMQNLGLWEGQGWLDKWRSHKKGKQELVAKPKNYVIEEVVHDPVAEMAERERRLADKRKGRQLLGTEPDFDTAELERWLKPVEPTTSPGMQKILQALEQEVHFQELRALAVPESLWMELSEVQQKSLYRLFQQYSQTDLSTIKDQALAKFPKEAFSALNGILAELELKITGMERSLEKNRKWVYQDAFAFLAAEQAEIQKKMRLESPEFKRSSAAQYGLYQSG